jgi:tRNA pseudouridine13 synthase
MFNAVLAERIRAGDWNTGREGEVWMLDGTQSVFGPLDPDDELRERLTRQDIHPTGPMWGKGELRSTGATRELEANAVAGFEDLKTGLETAGLKQERRALRVPVRELEWSWLQPDMLQLSFVLPPGAYATEVLAELGDIRP